MDRSSAEWTVVVEVPPTLAKKDAQHVLDCFSDFPSTRLIDARPYSQAHGVLFPMPIPTPTEVYWALVVSPALLKELVIWSLVTYTGKKVIDGLAAEAGKDLWKGIKALAAFVSERLVTRHEGRHSSPPYLTLTSSHGTGTAGADRIVIAIPLSKSESARLVNHGALERVVLPFVACLQEHRLFSRLLVWRTDEGSNTWTVQADNRTTHEINVGRKEVLSLTKAAGADAGFVDCLARVGLEVRYRRPWWKRLIGR